MGLTKKHLPGRLGSGAVALGAALGLVVVGPLGPANAYTTVDWTEVPLTQQELDANWITDRAVPSGDYASVPFDGREDVLEILIDKDNRSAGSTFTYTEGLKRDVDNLDAARMDLYVDSSWLANDTDVRAGFWGAGEPDGSGPYPIAEFTTAGADGYIGWRVWDSTVGWVNQPDISWNEDEWASIEIVLDQSNDAFDVIIDGHVVTTPALGSTALDAVMVNQYNYGPTGQSYDVHWSNFATGGLVEHDPTGEITSPSVGDEVSGTLNLAATYVDGDDSNDDAVQWAVRQGTCAAGTGTVAGNVDAFNNDYNWDGAEFTATLDVSEYESGKYCFVFNPTDDPGEANVRESVEFTITKVAPTAKDECKDGGWQEFATEYKNQGQCVADAQSNESSRHHRG